MSFLSPWFLLGLLGIGIPIAIHLLRREKAVKIPFSAVRFLKKAPKKSTFTHRFQQWLLMLTRIAILAILTVAFARPFLSSTASEWMGRAPESGVILLDTSMSMGYGDYFDRAREKAVDTLNRLHEAAVITFSDGIDQVKELTTDRPELESFLKTLKSPGFQGTQYLSALRMANQMLSAARHPNKVVYLISDFQHHAFENLKEDWRLNPDIRFEGIRIFDQETENLAITHVKVPHRLIRDRETHNIRVRLQNTGTQSITSASVSLNLNGKPVADQRVDFRNGSEAEVTLPVTFKHRGLHLGVISVGEDRLSADNQFYFTTSALLPVKILCIAPNNARDRQKDNSYWFRLALGNSEHSSFDLTQIRPRQFNPAESNTYDVIVLLNIGELSSQQVEGLQAYVENGGSLLLALADQANVQTFNRQFRGISPAMLQQKSVRADNHHLTITAVNNRHPIFQPLGSIDFNGTRFKDYWPVTPLKESTVLMELDGGEPVFLERSVGKGHVLLFASSLDTRWNNLALQSVYLPMLHEAVGYLAGREETKPAYRIGEPVPLNLSKGQLAGILDPKGHEVGMSYRSGNRSVFTDTHIPGFYAIRTTRFKEQIAVNTPALESVMRSVDPASVRYKVMQANPKPIKPSEKTDHAIKVEIEKSQHLWWWLLLTVFVLALGETLLANRTYR